MNLGISGETALVMSSTRGLGFGCAAALAAEGARVVINGRDGARGMEAAATIGECAHFVQADIRRRSERERLFEEARARLGAITILVTNADGPPSGAFTSKGTEDWQSAFELVMLSALDMVQRCLPDMVARGYGRIVNISSTSAKEITPEATLAGGIKPGLLGALGALAREVADKGVTVNSILPGPFDTDRIRRSAPRAVGRPDLPPAEAVKLLGERLPMRRLGAVEEIGALCVFLCSRQAGYITGQSIVIDGGLVPALL